MKRTSLLLPVLLAAGCASRADLEAAKQQVDVCERDKVAAQTAARDCETRCETESRRWSNIETQLTSTLPQTLRDFQDERAKIIELVPQEVRNQVAGRLDRYFAGVSREFDRMDGKLEGLREQLQASRAEIAEVASATRSVDSKIDATHRAVLSEQERSDERSRAVSEVIARIAAFDRDRISCEKCKTRIKLKGNGREQLLAFHSELIQHIQALEARAAREAPASLH